MDVDVFGRGCMVLCMAMFRWVGARCIEGEESINQSGCGKVLNIKTDEVQTRQGKAREGKTRQEKSNMHTVCESGNERDRQTDSNIHLFPWNHTPK